MDLNKNKIVTKYFYKDNSLRFQIFFLSGTGEMNFWKEFSNYNKYKEELDKIQSENDSGENEFFLKKSKVA